jgi:hypothetical protein
MIFTEQVADFVCEYMSEKAFRVNADLLSTLFNPEVKHVDRAGSSIIVAGGRRRSQVLNMCLDSPYHLRRQNIQYKSIRAPVCGTPGIPFLFFLREWTIHPPRLDFGFSQYARGDCFWHRPAIRCRHERNCGHAQLFADSTPESAVSLTALAW